VKRASQEGKSLVGRQVMNILAINSASDIPNEYKNTPVEKLLQYHNLGKEIPSSTNAEILIGMCMDNRKQIPVPENFAFIIRTGGGNLKYSEFKISFAIAVGGVTAVALIGHTDCGMVNLTAKKEKFIQGMVDKAGWDRKQAEEHFLANAPMFEINNEIEFTFLEAKRLRTRYPKITIAPMLYKVEDNRLYLITD
jgi:carbonic anhydrase